MYCYNQNILNKVKSTCIKKMEQENKSIEECLTINLNKKDKEVVRKQIKHWSLERIKTYIFVNELELLKKKTNLSIFIKRFHT